MYRLLYIELLLSLTDLMSKSVPSTSYLLATDEMSGLFLMFWPLALQVTLGKGWPVTPQWTRWLASLSFTICRAGGYMSVYRIMYVSHLCLGSVTKANWLDDNKVKLDIWVWVTCMAADVFTFKIRLDDWCQGPHACYPHRPAVLTWTPGRGPRAWSLCAPWPRAGWRWSPAEPLLSPGSGVTRLASPQPRPDTRQMQSCPHQLLWSPGIYKLYTTTYIPILTAQFIFTFLSPGWRYKVVLELSSETGKQIIIFLRSFRVLLWIKQSLMLL